MNINIQIKNTLANLSSCLSVVEINEPRPDHFYILYCDLNLRTTERISYKLFCLSETEMYNFIKTHNICDSKIISTYSYILGTSIKSGINFIDTVKFKKGLNTYNFFRDNISVFDYLIEKVERKQKLERLLNI